MNRLIERAEHVNVFGVISGIEYINASAIVAKEQMLVLFVAAAPVDGGVCEIVSRGNRSDRLPYAIVPQSPFFVSGTRGEHCRSGMVWRQSSYA